MSIEFINFPPAVVGLMVSANFEPDDAPDDTIEVTFQLPKEYIVSRKNVVLIDLDRWTEFVAELTENER